MAHKEHIQPTTSNRKNHSNDVSSNFRNGIAQEEQQEEEAKEDYYLYHPLIIISMKRHLLHCQHMRDMSTVVWSISLRFASLIMA
ncbi:hypothetical protein QJS10_CPB22g00726 [Acorus calamus]|uniref:Uncharacterized protein n=1 Tax=Acorus calamus TaxID=4465 RepID=A0AAV9C0M8_ACOCL|nr:hypothetical protein QJS10_CPB22g00726 [Acorus calamus]